MFKFWLLQQCWDYNSLDVSPKRVVLPFDKALHHQQPGLSSPQRDVFQRQQPFSTRNPVKWGHWPQLHQMNRRYLVFEWRSLTLHRQQTLFSKEMRETTLMRCTLHGDMIPRVYTSHGTYLSLAHSLGWTDGSGKRISPICRILRNHLEPHFNPLQLWFLLPRAARRV